MSELPTQAQVVIIGGGVGGASIAYHLTLMGWKDVVLLERHELTAGSTWHSAGLVGQMRSDANLTRMMHYSTDLYRKLKAETGQDTSWREVGGIRLASSAERMEENKRLVGMARSFGVDMELISPKEAHDKFPLISLDGVLVAAFTATAEAEDPYGNQDTSFNGNVTISLNNFCKLQDMGPEDEDDILSCVHFLLVDVMTARHLLGSLAG